MTRLIAIATFAVLVVLAGPASAADTAFWKPYEADDATYALFHFDTAELGKSEVKATSAEVVGAAKADPQGRFGGCLSLDGKGGLKFVPAATFPGGFLAIEAWVKLSRYPEKEAYIVCRPFLAGKTKGFALLVDSKGRLHLETTNLLYGKATRTSSPEAAVPLGRWVHLAGVSDTFPTNMRRLYVDGREVQALPLAWGEGLTVSGDEETQAGPCYIGNNAAGDAGLAGLIDEVRIHRRVVKYWPREEPAWTKAPAPLPVGEPYVSKDHAPRVYLPLNGDLAAVAAPGTATAPAVKDLKITGDPAAFVPRGAAAKAYAGKLSVAAPGLLDMRQGTVEFWVHPVGVDNYANFNTNILSFGWATFYIYNTGVVGVRLPLALYFARDDGQLTFVSVDDTDFHSGRWYHVAITWNRRYVSIYLDGKLAVESQASLATRNNKGVADSLTLNPGGKAVAEFAEVRLYDRRLLPEEVANCRGRALEGYQPVPIPFRPVEIRAEYLPSQNKVYYQLTQNVPAETIRLCGLLLWNAKDANASDGVPIANGGRAAITEDEQVLDIPALPDGIYRLEVVANLANRQHGLSDWFIFKRKHFAWEGNQFGITDQVPPPFEPIVAAGDQAKVVLRTYKMNGFGLWDGVTALGRDILAGPMTLRYETAEGEGKWTAAAGGKFTTAKPNLAVYEARATAGPVVVQTKSSIEIDGCMKVEMSLLPGQQPAEIKRLWLEVPLKDAEASLMHTVGAGVRSNYSGAAPAGSGVVWDGSKQPAYIRWLNAFVPYIWLGAEQRGLAWFAENDKGWLTAKSPAVPVQQIVREGGRLTLRVYLVNVPTTLRERHDLVFGMQASPTKPMPEDWRRKLPAVPGGLAVVPWGGLDCPYQGPYRDDWRIVDKLVEARLSGKLDLPWFLQYVKEHNPPLVHGNWGWLSAIEHFAGRCIDAGPGKPIAVYHEEMMAGKLRPEWEVFYGEWGPTATFHRSHAVRGGHAGLAAWPDDSALREGSSGSNSTPITFPASYRDFGVYFADQWLRRGVSLYWDNTYPNHSYNPRTSAAYRTDAGIQPAVIIWNQREYHKRVYNCLAQWRTKRAEPLEWVLHMTNTLLLPVHTWGTANLDHEMSVKVPFSPDWLRTETIARQVGSMPMSLYPVSGTGEAMKDAPPAERAIIEWGMRAVHEIQRTGEMEKLLVEYGYGTPAVVVHNYWADKPALKVTPANVKWLVLAKPKDKTCLIVLASWSAKPERVEITVDPAVLGFPVEGPVQELPAKAGAGEIKGNAVAVEMKYPYHAKVLTVTAKP